MVFLSPLGFGAQVIGRRRRRHRRRPHSSRVVKPDVINSTVSPGFQLKRHGQERKQLELEEIHEDNKDRGNFSPRFQLKRHGDGQKRKQLELEETHEEKKARGNFSSSSSSSCVFDFNDEVLAREILSWLPVKSLVRFKSVCKYWLFLVEQDTTFINLHLERSRARPCLLITNFIRDESRYQLITGDLLFGKGGRGAIPAATFHTVREVDFTDCDLMLKPVHGLVGIFGERRIDPGVCISNISTREITPWIESKLLRDLREKDLYASRAAPKSTCTLGYDPATKKHKVVGVWRSSEPFYEVCEVLTVGENEWRQIDEVPPYRLELHGSSVYIDGSIYYSTNLLFQCEANKMDKSRFIVAFDVGRERFRTIKVPNYIFDRPDYECFWVFYNVVLLDLDGRLGLLIQIAKVGYTPKLWLFDNDGGKKKSKNSWTEVPIELPGDRFGYSFGPVSGTDQIIMTSYVKTSDGKKSDTTCHSYNWKQKSLNETEVSGITSAPYFSSTSRVAAFFESLLHVQNRGSSRSSSGDWGVDELIVEDCGKQQVGGALLKTGELMS